MLLGEELHIDSAWFSGVVENKLRYQATLFLLGFTRIGYRRA
jgi:hypothetical protein